MFNIRRTVMRLASAGLVAGAAMIGMAAASNIPLMTGPLDPSGLLGYFNQLIQSINANVGGLTSAQTAAVATGTGTAEQTLQTYTLPANALSAAGQSLRVSCWGPTAANTNNKTAKLYFGASVVATPVMATSAETWFLDYIVMRRTATTQGFLGRGAISTGPAAVAPIVTDGAETLTAGVVIKCTGTDGTSSAGDLTANGMIVEMIR